MSRLSSGASLSGGHSGRVLEDEKAPVDWASATTPSTNTPGKRTTAASPARPISRSKVATSQREREDGWDLSPGPSPAGSSSLTSPPPPRFNAALRAAMSAPPPPPGSGSRTSGGLPRIPSVGKAARNEPRRASTSSTPTLPPAPNASGIPYSTVRAALGAATTAARRAALEAEQDAELQLLRAEYERQTTEQNDAAVAAIVAAQDRARAEADVKRLAEDAELKFLNDYANFPVAELFSKPFSEEEHEALLAFLQHPDTTLISETAKDQLTPDMLAGHLYDPASHFSLELLLVHLRHLDLTGVEFPSLAAIKVGVEFAENYSEQHGAGATSFVARGAKKGPANHGGSFAIRRKIFLYLHRPDVLIYPTITWTEVEQLFILTLAGPRLGSILYRLDQIGIAFKSFQLLLTHVAEIYARKATTHSRNVDTLLNFLTIHSAALFMEPMAPSRGLAKKVLELGLGVSTSIYLTEGLLAARRNFNLEARFLTALKFDFAQLRDTVKKVHAFLVAEPRMPVATANTADMATRGSCVLATGPVVASTAVAKDVLGRRREKLPAPASLTKPKTFLTRATLEDAERLVRESGPLAHADEEEGDGTDENAAGDQVLAVLIELNTQVDLQLKGVYTSLEQLIFDVKAARLIQQAQVWGLPDDPLGLGGLDGAEAIKARKAAEEGAVAARERTRKARARKRALVVAGILVALREYLLSTEATALRCKKEHLVITDADLQTLLAAGGGSFESVRGHTRQLADQGIFSSSVTELQRNVTYSHSMALDQQADHRAILFAALRDGGLLDPGAFPPRGAGGEYVSNADALVDDALNALLCFNAFGARHPFPRAQVAQSDYYHSPRATMHTLAFMLEILREQRPAPGAAAATEDDEDAQAEHDSEGTSTERQVRNLDQVLLSVHAAYAAYLHAKKQVLDFFHAGGSKCALRVMGIPTTAAEILDTPALAGSEPRSPASESGSVAPLRGDVPIDLLGSCDLTDVGGVFEGAHVGLKVLPYLLELSYAGTVRTYAGWSELKRALASLHASKSRANTDQASEREQLRNYLQSVENRILRAISGAAATRKVSHPWVDAELDQVLQASGSDVAHTLNLLRAMNRDGPTLARLNSVPVVVASVRQYATLALAQATALRTLLASPAGRRLLPSQGSTGLSIHDAERVVEDSTAQIKTLAYTQQMISAGKVCSSVDDLVAGVRALQNETSRQENKELMVLSTFFASSTAHLFVGGNAAPFTEEDVAAIHAEKLGAPFSLLLLSLSAITASEATFDSPSDFRDALHQRHVALIADHTKTLAILSTGEVASRLFAFTASSPAVSVEEPRPPFTPKVILDLFEQLEAQVSVSDALQAWEAAARRFKSWSDMVDALHELKAEADLVQRGVEEILDSRHQVRLLLNHYALLPDNSLRSVSNADIDGLLSLDLGGGGLALAVPALHEVFASLRAQDILLESFAHLVRVVQVELDDKAVQFQHKPDQDEVEAPKAIAKSQHAHQHDDEPEAQAAQGRSHLISAPVNMDAPSDVASDVIPPLEVVELPSQRAARKFVLFMPTDDPLVAPLAPATSTTRAREQLVAKLLELAARQPWLGEDPGQVTAPEEVIQARKFELLSALSWPACHIFNGRRVPIVFRDDELAGLLLAFGGGPRATARAIDFLRALDAKGEKCTDAEDLLKRAADYHQRAETRQHLATFGGLLCELVGEARPMQPEFISDLVSAISGGAALELDPMLPLSHLLARTQAFFESARARDGAQVPLSHFLDTLTHFALTERRGVLRSLLVEGLPPNYEQALFSPNASYQKQLTDRRLDAILAAQAGSIDCTVRTLKALEAEALQFETVQELQEAFMRTASSRAAARRAEAVSSDSQLEAARLEKERRQAEIEAEADDLAKMKLIANVEDPDDPVLFSRRQAIFLGLSAPQTRLFDLRRDHLALTDADLDEIVTLGGGLPSALHYISRLDEDGLKFFSFERCVTAMAERRQYDLVCDYWTSAQNTAAQCVNDLPMQKSCAEGQTGYRLFTREAVDESTPLTREFFHQMIQEGMGAIDPLCPLLAVLSALQRRDGSAPMPAPLFDTRAELILAIQREAQLFKRHKLALYLTDPARPLLTFPKPIAPTVTPNSAPPKFCRWEGLSASEADELLGMCENSLFLCLRHCRMLERSGFNFSTSLELLEALVLTQQHLVEEEADQRSPISPEDRQLQHDQEDAQAEVSVGGNAESQQQAEVDSARQDSNDGQRPLAPKVVTMAPTMKLSYQPGHHTSGHPDAAGYLAPFDPDDDGREVSMSHATRRVEERWRSTVETSSLQRACLSALRSSPLFSECSPFPTFAAADLDTLLACVKGDLAALQSALLELERQHQRYVDAAGFLRDLRALSVEAAGTELLGALSYPSCSIFADTETAVDIDSTHLRQLVRAAGHSLAAARKYIRVLDEQNVRCESADALVDLMQRLHIERRRVKHTKAVPEPKQQPTPEAAAAVVPPSPSLPPKSILKPSSSPVLTSASSPSQPTPLTSPTAPPAIASADLSDIGSPADAPPKRRKKKVRVDDGVSSGDEVPKPRKKSSKKKRSSVTATAAPPANPAIPASQ